MVQMNLSSGSSSNIEVENERTCGHRAGVGWIGRLGLTYVHCHKQMDTGILYTCFYWSIYHNVLQLLEKTMATHSSTLAWKIPWTEEPGRLQSMGSLRVSHDWTTSLSLFTFMHWRREWQPTPVFLLGESQGRGSMVSCRLWGPTESDTTEAT